jgi:L-amino acid N-acyltransferase YncA
MLKITYKSAQTDTDLQQILDLQQRNLKRNLAHLNDGFVTAEHDLPLLRAMNHPFPHTIALHEGKIIGYALSMEPSFRAALPVLVPMFDTIDTIVVDGNALKHLPYIVMGQVCIAEGYRGMGIFGGLYRAMQRYLSPHFAYCVTEVSLNNHRSLRAHSKVGFHSALQYQLEGQEPWDLLVWKWA